jgi:hypothetical protein
VRKTLGRLAQPAEGLISRELSDDPGRRRTPMLREKVVQLLEASMHRHCVFVLQSPYLQDRYASPKNPVESLSEIGVELIIKHHHGLLSESLRKTTESICDRRYNADFDDPDNFTYGFFHYEVITASTSAPAVWIY